MKKYFLSLAGIQLFVALGAIPAGILYLSDPSGTAMGNSTEMLAHSPFSNYLIPGLFLLIVIGLGSLAVSILSFLRKETASAAGIILGSILCIWIIIQVYWIGYLSFLQPLMFAVGLAEILTGLIIRKHQSR